MSAERLSEFEILKLREDAESFVRTYMRTSNNPSAKLGPHNRGCVGMTHVTWDVEGINDANISFNMMRKFVEMFPHDEHYTTEASISQETRADGRTIVMKLNIPILFGVRSKRTKGRVQSGEAGAGQMTFEWPLLLTMVEGVIGGILYWKYSNGTLF